MSIKQQDWSQEVRSHECVTFPLLGCRLLSEKCPEQDGWPPLTVARFEYLFRVSSHTTFRVQAVRWQVARAAMPCNARVPSMTCVCVQTKDLFQNPIDCSFVPSQKENTTKTREMKRLAGQKLLNGLVVDFSNQPLHSSFLATQVISLHHSCTGSPVHQVTSPVHHTWQP